MMKSEDNELLEYEGLHNARENNDKILDVIIDARYYESQLEENGNFAITITFIDHVLSKYKRTYLRQLIREIIKKTRNIYRIILIPELSKVGRFHYHGVVKCRDINVINRLKLKLSILGICQVKCIDNTMKWAHYCVKSYDHNDCIYTRESHVGPLKWNKHLLIDEK